MSRELSPISPGAAEGYYVKRAKVVQIAGQDNFDLGFNLDNDATVADEAVAQAVFDRGDNWLDMLLWRCGAIAPPARLPVDHLAFPRLSDLASQWARVEGYQLRGTTGAEGGDEVRAADGQMSQMRKRAETEATAIAQWLARRGTPYEGVQVVRGDRGRGLCLPGGSFIAANACEGIGGL